jgi:hypothetical protein
MVTLPRLDWIKNATLQISNYNRFGVWLGLVSTEVKKEPSKILFSNEMKHISFSNSSIFTYSNMH